MFRGASALEPQESEMHEFVEFDPVTDEIRYLRILFPLHFFVFNQTVSHLGAEDNVEQMFSKTFVKDIMDKYYEMFRGKNRGNKTVFFNRPEDVQDSDTDG
jgi:hypothetical protein